MYEREDITPELVRRLVSYDPNTGLMTWRPRDIGFFSDGGHSASHTRARWNTRYAGKPAFASNHSQGYLFGCIFKHGFLAHRVGWACHYGAWPTDEIDHINHDRADNRISNLREASRPENAQNGKSHCDSASEFLGVSFMSRDGVWVAQLKSKYLGRFQTEREAARAYDAAARSHFGDFANLNFPNEEPQ